MIFFSRFWRTVQLLFLPGHLPSESFIQTDARRPAQMAVELRSVGMGIALVPWTARRPSQRCPAGNDSFQLTEHIPDGDRFAAPPVIGFTRNRLHGRQGGIYAVRDVRVAAHLIPVAV